MKKNHKQAQIDIQKTKAAAKATTATDPATATPFKLAELGVEAGEPAGGRTVGEDGAKDIGGAGGEAGGDSVGEEVGTAETGDGGEAIGDAEGETVGATVGDWAKADPTINAINVTTITREHAIAIVDLLVCCNRINRFRFKINCIV